MGGFVRVKKRLYELECNACGHVQVDTNIWKHCLVTGCNGLYVIVEDYPAGF
jgi:hypothetical protein